MAVAPTQGGSTGGFAPPPGAATPQAYIPRSTPNFGQATLNFAWGQFTEFWGNQITQAWNAIQGFGL